jgi:hypothetical protein
MEGVGSRAGAGAAGGVIDVLPMGKEVGAI